MKSLLLFIPLLFMAYEDFRFRAIHWPWLLLLTAGILLNYSFNPAATLINLLLVASQIALLTLYFSIKQGYLVYLPAQHLGWGDILFYVPLCLIFSPGNLLFFTVGSFALTLLFFGAYQLISKKGATTIPLAGCLSICLLGVLIFGFQKGIDLKEDTRFLAMLISTMQY